MAGPIPREQYGYVERYRRTLYGDDGYTPMGTAVSRGLRYTTLLIEGDALQHEVREKETLMSIARRYYGNDGLWWVIADANPDLMNPMLDLAVASVLLVPRLNA